MFMDPAWYGQVRDVSMPPQGQRSTPSFASSPQLVSSAFPNELIRIVDSRAEYMMGGDWTWKNALASSGLLSMTQARASAGVCHSRGATCNKLLTLLNSRSAGELL